MILANSQAYKIAYPLSCFVILSEAKDLRSQHAQHFAVEHDHVRAQDSCAPTCPGVHFNPALFLTSSSDRTF